MCPKCGSTKFTGSYSGPYQKASADLAILTYSISDWGSAKQAVDDIQMRGPFEEFLDDGHARPLDNCKLECSQCGSTISLKAPQLQKAAERAAESIDLQKLTRKRKPQPLQIDAISPVSDQPVDGASSSWTTCPRCLEAGISLLAFWPRTRSEFGKAKGSVHVDATGVLLDIDEANPQGVDTCMDLDGVFLALNCLNDCSPPFLLLDPGDLVEDEEGTVVFQRRDLDRTRGLRTHQLRLIEAVAMGQYANTLLCLLANPDCDAARQRRLMLLQMDTEWPSHAHDTSYADACANEDWDSACISLADQVLKNWHHTHWFLMQAVVGNPTRLPLLERARERMKNPEAHINDEEASRHFGAGLEYQLPCRIAWRDGKNRAQMTVQEAHALVNNPLVANSQSGVAVQLLEVRDIPPEVARVLTKFGGRCEVFDADGSPEDVCDGLALQRASLTAVAARELGKADLPDMYLYGGLQLDHEIAQALACYRGWLGLTCELLPLAAAGALANGAMKCLYLDGLKAVDPGAAEALSAFPGVLMLASGINAAAMREFVDYRGHLRVAPCTAPAVVRELAHGRMRKLDISMQPSSLQVEVASLLSQGSIAAVDVSFYGEGLPMVTALSGYRGRLAVTDSFVPCTLDVARALAKSNLSELCFPNFKQLPPEIADALRSFKGRLVMADSE